MTKRLRKNRHRQLSTPISDIGIEENPVYPAESLPTLEFSSLLVITSRLEQDLIFDLMKTTAINSAIDTAIQGYPAMLRITSLGSSTKLELIDFKDWRRLK